MFIDVHCHLSSDLFDTDIDSIIKKAEDAGITRILSVGENYEDNLRVLDLTSRYPIIKAGLGHHPESTDIRESEKTLKLIEQNYEKISCIGEIGLDFFKIRDHTERDVQESIFREFIKTGIKFGLPLSVHSRSAGDKAIEILNSFDLKIPVNMHAFSGKGGKARDAAEKHGYFFSIPGSIFYSAQKQKLARLVPEDRLLLETDSPVMSPVKGQVNYPSNLPVILKELARIRKADPDTLEQLIYNNSVAYLSLKGQPDKNK